MAPPRKSARKSKPKFKIRSWREARAKRRARVAEIVTRLHRDYPDADCALTYSSPWELLVATILSAQCTDERVNQETPALFARYPTIAEMAAAVVVDNFNGELPRDFDDLLTLRGVARKTANVVLGTAFGIPSGVVVDTHIGRLSQRLGFTKETDPGKVEQALIDLLERDEWIFTGHALIWHGRRVCDARKPDCTACRLRDLCPSSTATE